MIITIGAFDGFHKGHARLFDMARMIDDASKKGWGVVSFYPHPGVFMGGLKATLFTLRERELVRRFLNIPSLLTLEFNQELKDLSPEEFLQRLKHYFESELKTKIDGFVAGSDFHFGRAQAGTARTLENFCARELLIFVLLDLKKAPSGTRFSSTDARRAVARGQLHQAELILGYPWFLWSRVVRGNQRGRTMGFPTANLDLSEGRVLPARGVYAAAVPLPSKGKKGLRWHCAALSIGNNPTFGDVREQRAEVFIMDFQGDLYDADLPVFPLKRLRPMRPFENAQALSEQIAQDVTRCREAFDLTFQEPEKSALFARFASCLKEMNAKGPFVPQVRRLDAC